MMSFILVFALGCTHSLVSATPVSMPEECLTQDELSCNDVFRHCGIVQVAERCPHTCGLCPTYNPTMMPSNEPSVAPSSGTTLSPTVGPTISPTRYIGCSDGIPDELFCHGKPELCPLFGRDICRYTCNMCPTESPSIMPTVLPTTFPTQLPSVFPTLLENNRHESVSNESSASSASSASSSSSASSASEILVVLSLVFSYMII